MRELKFFDYHTKEPIDVEEPIRSTFAAGLELPGDVVGLAEDLLPFDAPVSGLSREVRDQMHGDLRIEKVHCYVYEDAAGRLSVAEAHLQFEGKAGLHPRHEFHDARKPAEMAGALLTLNDTVWFIGIKRRPWTAFMDVDRPFDFSDPIEISAMERGARSTLVGRFRLGEGEEAAGRDFELLKDLEPAWGIGKFASGDEDQVILVSFEKCDKPIADFQLQNAMREMEERASTPRM